eukprot:g30243.t1
MKYEDKLAGNIKKKNILGKLKDLTTDKSPGPAGLHSRVLKEIAEEIVEVLAVIFQESLEPGRVPEDWKMVNIAPLFKRGGRQKMGNYRLVNLSSVLGEILLPVIKAQIAEYLEMHDDTKIGGGPGSVEDAGRLQKDPDRLGEWAKKWQIANNVGKFE